MYFLVLFFFRRSGTIHTCERQDNDGREVMEWMFPVPGRDTAD
ncbi:hypothetical protein E2C01_091130 [Portunus trituberculatus]|uniref:Uncharacterized protein n=1 Tax=Portunus trituberculatus TaxID=210409 RepID=A0A5B7JD69_PORTR|nr:hypothetical protein [Portunus trituberculatus]